jgi:hypothetical protein
VPDSSDSSDTTLDSSIPVLQDVLVPGNPAHARVGADTLPPASTAPVEPAGGMTANAVTANVVTQAHVQAFEAAEPPAPFELAQAPEPEPLEPSSVFHFGRTSSSSVQSLDADVLAERLRGRFASYLTGEGRTVIEARCRDALQDHTTWLVSQITREVALALETEMTGWVREAVEEELARRSKQA